MKTYAERISSTKLVREVESTTTTGDLDYSGTALEIWDEADHELFHVVVDENGEQQFLFFASPTAYRIPLKVMEQIVARAKEAVNRVDS